MKGTVGSAPDIHNQTGSASEASIADARTRSRIVGEAGAYRLSAINATMTDPASFIALPRVADPGLGMLTIAYQSSPGCGAAVSNRSAIRFDLAGLCGARIRRLHRSFYCSRRFDNFLEPIAVSMRPLCNFAMSRRGDPRSVFVARKIVADLGDEFIGRRKKRRFVVVGK